MYRPSPHGAGFHFLPVDLAKLDQVNGEKDKSGRDLSPHEPISPG